MATEQEIRTFWDDQARTHGMNLEATTPDRYLRELEVSAIARHLPVNAGVIADVGCGNGWSTVRFKKVVPNTFIYGIDFSSDMIAQCPPTDGISWNVGDVRSLPYADGSIPCVTTARCLINLTSDEEHERALKEIHRVLADGGLYVMAENTFDGLLELNVWRTQVGLPPILERWHNRYLRAEALQAMNALFVTLRVEGFETYYKLSRVVNGRLAADRNEEPKYDSRVNEIAAQLPQGAVFGPLRVYVLRKR